MRLRVGLGCVVAVALVLGSGVSAFAEPVSPTTTTGTGGAPSEETNTGGGGGAAGGPYTVPPVYVPGSSGGGKSTTPADPWDHVPRQTKEETGRGGWSAGGGAIKGGDKSGKDKNKDKTTKTPPEQLVNPNAGKSTKPQKAVIEVLHVSDDGKVTKKTVTLTSLKDLFQRLGPHRHGPISVDGNFEGWFFDHAALPGVSWQTLARAVFKLTGGTFINCGPVEAVLGCFLVKGMRPSEKVPTPFETLLGSWVEGERSVPLCAGLIVDSGPGLEVRVSTEDVGCEADGGVEPVRVEWETLYADPALGVPSTDPVTGDLVFEATPAAAGKYVPVLAYAVAPDGTTSFPFYVVFRNRYAPEPVATSAPFEVIRGVETVLTRTQLVRDVDVDEHAMESGDSLTFEVVRNGKLGKASFDANGNLRYIPRSDVPGVRTDDVVVRVIDRFGLSSGEFTVQFRITDVVPGCVNGGKDAPSGVPVKFFVDCTLTTPVGWKALTPMVYSISRAPAEGSVVEFDPVKGTGVFIPGPFTKGPVTFEVTADNNGATRTFHYTINITG